MKWAVYAFYFIAVFLFINSVFMLYPQQLSKEQVQIQTSLQLISGLIIGALAFGIHMKKISFEKMSDLAYGGMQQIY